MRWCFQVYFAAVAVVVGFVVVEFALQRNGEEEVLEKGFDETPCLLKISRLVFVSEKERNK